MIDPLTSTRVQTIWYITNYFNKYGIFREILDWKLFHFFKSLISKISNLFFLVNYVQSLQVIDALRYTPNNSREQN